MLDQARSDKGEAIPIMTVVLSLPYVNRSKEEGDFVGRYCELYDIM